MTETEAHAIASVPTGLYIGGRWLPGSDGGSIDVHDPSTELVLAQVADGTAEDGLLALDAAASAAQAWAGTPPRRRSEVLRTAFDLLRAEAERFALIITLEMGKPLAEARSEVSYGGEFLRWFSEEAVRIDGRYGLNPEGTGSMVVSRRPVGPCLLVTPWNFPLAMATRKIAPALAAGCTVVLKPSELTPLTALALADLLQRAGVPDGVVNVVTTKQPGSVVSAVLADPRLRKLSFTGSTGVGRLLLRRAADNVLRTSMELGGNAPFLVFDDADLDAAVDGAMVAKFRNVGQACTAANRFLVHTDVADAFVGRLTDRVGELRVGRGTEPGAGIGPVIDEGAVTKLTRLVDDAVARGAVVQAGGGRPDRPGSFFEPTVLDNAGEGMAVTAEEIFGPVAVVQRFGDEEEAVRLANATPYGLMAYVFTGDHARVQRMLRHLETGMLAVNSGLASNAAAPFGGVKQSGLGREGGHEGIEEYLETTYALLPETV